MSELKETVTCGRGGCGRGGSVASFCHGGYVIYITLGSFVPQGFLTCVSLADCSSAAAAAAGNIDTTGGSGRGVVVVGLGDLYVVRRPDTTLMASLR